MLKHKLKLALRESYARVLFHTGLHAVVNRIMPTRLTILAGHCVEPASGDWEGGAHLPGDMKIGEDALEALVRWMQRRYRMVTIGEGVEALANGGGRSMVALSVDDGYRDNHDVLLPLLERTGVPATVFLESRPLDERRVNWTHKLFWLMGREDDEAQAIRAFVDAYGEHAGQTDTFHAMNQVVTEDRDGRLLYQVKRILKYDADFDERDRAIDAIFVDAGGREAELCDALYMTWDHARALRDGGVELGGHTVNHPILARLTPEEQAREIAQGRESMVRELGTEPATFAYPFGRRWDFDRTTRDSVRSSGFKTAVTMHSGTNHRGADPTTYHRLALADGVKLHLLVAEACGGFALARRFGLDLSE